MALPVTILGSPNAVVQVQPGMQVQAACIISPPAAAILTTAPGGRGNVSVSVQPGMQVKAVCLVNRAGQFISL